MAAKATTGQHQPAAPNQGKSLIDKDNLRDEYLDKLVIDISNLVSKEDQKKCKTQGQPLQQNSCSTGGSGSIDCCHSNADDEQVYEESAIQSGASTLAGKICPSQQQETELCRLNNQPKRPMNAFMVWGRAIRREIHLRFSNVQNALLSKALGRVWRSLDSAAKEPFVRKANLIKANHRRDYPYYRYQPRRLQDSDRSKTEATNSNIRSTSQSTSQYIIALDDKIDGQTGSASATFGSIYPVIDGLEQHRHYHRRIRTESSIARPRFREHEGSFTNPVGLNYGQVANFVCQDNNHINSSGYTRNGEYRGTSDDHVVHMKTHHYYHEEYQETQQQHHDRPLLPTKQHPAPGYTYSGSYQQQHQYQFAYGVQLQQNQLYQQPHQLIPPSQQQPPCETGPRFTFAENCSLSAVNTGCLEGNRFLALQTTVESMDHNKPR